MKIMLATLALNEMEWLPRLWAQHKDWPGMERWVFVESADRVYADVNPDMVSPAGLSVDGTTEFLQELTRIDNRVRHLRLGFCYDTNPAQGKCMARNQYLIAADEIKPKFVYVLDADEFYMKREQERIINRMTCFPTLTAFRFKQRHIWRPPSIACQPLFSREVIRGFWEIPHVRGWRWLPGMRYRDNHNTPETPEGKKLDGKMMPDDRRVGSPFCIHMGFASGLKERHAKHAYYAARGEGRVDHRAWYVESRAAFETWKIGDILPRDAKVIPYNGPIPEAFQ